MWGDFTNLSSCNFIPSTLSYGQFEAKEKSPRMAAVPDTIIHLALSKV